MRALRLFKAKKSAGIASACVSHASFGMARCLCLNVVSPRLLARKTFRFFGITHYSQRTKAEPREFPAHWRAATSVQEWRSNVFIQKHIVKRGNKLVCEGTETRAFCICHPDDPDRIQAMLVPEEIKALFS